MSDDDWDDDTVPCPYCGKAVYEDAERCPYCENYLSREDAPGRQPTWIVIGVLVCLVLVAGWILGWRN
jgi:predicted nucleic acid-binding Zn ribbon protein